LVDQQEAVIRDLTGKRTHSLFYSPFCLSFTLFSEPSQS